MRDVLDAAPDPRPTLSTVRVRPLIIIVDDSADIRDAVEFTLRAEGYEVIACDDAEHGFASVRAERPELVITDVLLGVDSGLDLVTRIRSDLPAPLPPIITWSGCPGVAAEAERRGAIAFIAKPFDVETLLAAVAAALGGRAPADETLARAGQQTRRLREAAVAAARAARVRLGPRDHELSRRGLWACNWLSGYLGFGETMVVLIDGERLEVLASSTNCRLRAGEVVDMRVPLARDVVEAGSTIVLPDLHMSAPSGASSAATGFGFFAGAPLYAGKTAVGAICMVDEQPRRLDADDFSLFECLGRRASSVLGGVEVEEEPPFFEESGLLSTEGFEWTVGAAVRRAQRRHEYVEVLFFVVEARHGWSWPDGLARCLSPRRLAVAELGGDRFGLLLARPDGDTAAAHLAAAIRYLRDQARLRAGGVVSLASDLPAIGERELIRFAEALQVRELRAGHRRVARVVLRHEPLHEPPTAPPPTAIPLLR
jgi:DNA-binding response OmpR family regulator